MFPTTSSLQEFTKAPLFSSSSIHFDFCLNDKLKPATTDNLSDLGANCPVNDMNPLLLTSANSSLPLS